MQASEFLDIVSAQLLDTGDTRRWPTAELLGHLNEARQFLAVARPDVYAATVNKPLEIGKTRQTLPVEALSLNAVRRIDGRYLRETDLATVAQISPGWPGTPGAPSEFWFDAKEPRVFWLYPVPDSGDDVELTVTNRPVALDATDAVDLGAEYFPALKDYVMYRALQKETEDADYQRSAGYLQAVLSYLRLDSDARGQFAPRSGPPSKEVA